MPLAYQSNMIRHIFCIRVILSYRSASALFDGLKSQFVNVQVNICAILLDFLSTKWG